MARALDAASYIFIGVSLPVLLNMGKKSRRRDEKRGPSAAEKNQNKIVTNIEKGDPSYLHFHKLPNALSCIVVKSRFGGTDPWGGRSVKITAALVG